MKTFYNLKYTKKNFKKRFKLHPQNRPIIFICSIFFTLSPTSHRQHDFLLSLFPHIINYNHFKFSTKQLIMLINTFQSSMREWENALIINLLSPSLSLSLTHPRCQKCQFWVLITMQWTKKATFLDLTLVTRSSSFRSVEIVMTLFLHPFLSSLSCSLVVKY